MPFPYVHIPKRSVWRATQIAFLPYCRVGMRTYLRLLFSLVIISVLHCSTCLAQVDTLRFLQPFMFNVGGQFHISSSTTRPTNGNTQLPQSSLRIETSPHIHYLFTQATSGGLDLALHAERKSDIVVVAGIDRELRQSERGFRLLPQITFYQPALARLYAYQRIGFGIGSSNITAALYDGGRPFSAEQQYRVRSSEGQAALGVLLFFRNIVAISGQLGYNFAWDRVNGYGQQLSGTNYYIPTGFYRRQGLAFQLGFEVFFKAKGAELGRK
jgi:hypothetical protein